MIVISLVLLACEKAVWFLVGHPKELVGKAPGASSIVRPVARVFTWLPERIRKWMGQYIQSHHPRAWIRLRQIFQ